LNESYVQMSRRIHSHSRSHEPTREQIRFMSAFLPRSISALRAPWTGSVA
jgi:hypothetical protein